MTATALRSEPSSLLGPGEPPPFTRIGADRPHPVVVVADHASNRIPTVLDDLGLPEEPRRRHIAYDIGIADVAHGLAERLGVPLLLNNYSRLVIDPNRPLDDPTSIPVISDGVIVPGNRDLDDGAAAERVDRLFRPYHAAVQAQIDVARRYAEAPALISLHSFTPSLRGFPRPWHAGILWSDDDRMAGPLIAHLAAEDGLMVGDNKPYSGQHRYGYTVETHALAHGFPNVLVEVRQDLIAEPAGAAAWADRLARCLAPILADTGLYKCMGGQ